MTDKGPVCISNYYVFMVAIASGTDADALTLSDSFGLFFG